MSIRVSNDGKDKKGGGERKHGSSNREVNLLSPVKKVTL
jgi:hypothetical protein